MVLLGEMVLIVGVTEIIKKLLPVIEEHISPVAWGVKDHLRKLKLTLEAIQALVSDAEINQLNDEAARLWLRKLKDVLYDADDVIDQYSYEYMRRNEMGNQLKHKVRDFVSYSSSNRLLFRFRIARQIRAINKTLDEIHKENKRYNRPISAPGINFGQSTEKGNLQTSAKANSVLLGREDAKSDIISMMLNSRSSTSISSSSVNSSQQANPWVVSIVGMGGLGKTTLAQLLFKDSNLGNFDSKAWVCVSDDFRISNILIKMIESIDNGTKHGGSSDLEALGSQISIRLNGKNFLLVLDDLWNEDSRYWGQLMDSLVCTGAKSIKILITTRSSKVGFVVGGSTYRLQRLKNDVCWSIMEKVISTRDERILALERMTTIGKDIVKRCDGLPLAADFLGSLMASNTDESHWLKIKDHINLWNTAESKRLLSNIKLSYDKLPSPLKQCFSYCSIFPKDWIIERETLTRLWMAEGFLPLTDVLNCSSIEDIGNYYFDLLLSNSLFQDVETDELGVVMTCKMHDIVHDLAMTVVDREEYGILQSREGTEDTSKVRRLQHVCSEGSSGTIPGALSKAKRLRTVAAVAPKNCSQINSFFSNKRLRVLYPLGGWDKKICTSIPKLKHLRYLDLSGCKIDSVNDIKALNRSYNLLTLVLRGCVNAWLVLRKIKSLKSLRHLDLSYSDIKALPDSTVGLTNLQHLNLSHCDKFEALPENIGLLIHLSFLDLSYTAIKRLPESITRLSNLRILEFPRDLDALPREFGALTQLRRLDVRGTEIKELPESCTRTGGNLEIVKLGGNCKFPRDIKNWPKLKHFTHERVAGDEPTPRGMENLIYLETLESYMVRKEPAQLCSESTGHRSGIEELSALNYLQVLHIHNIENLMGGKEGAERAKLKDKQHMRELYLKWSSEKKDGYLVFEGLQPHPNLRKLVIQGFQGYGLPTWITGTRSSNCLLQNLVELELLYVDIDEKLPALGMLPNLRVLRIAHGMKSTKYLGVCDIQTLLEDESSSKIGKVKLSSSIYTQPLFQSLIELKIEGMDNLEELITHRDPFLHCATCQCFASLEVLKIQGCERLRSIPLTLFSSLKELQLSSTTDKVTSLFLHPGVEGGRCLESLTSIIIVDVEDLIYLPPPLVLLQNCAPRLEYLHITGCKKFQGFQEDHDDINTRYSSLGLRSLKLHDCAVLMSLPNLRSWTFLKSLEILKCDKLQESLPYDLKSLTFLQLLRVDFIQNDEQQGRDLVTLDDLVNLME